MNENLLSARNLVKRYGSLLVTDGVSLDVCQGEIHAIIGPNGAGKTTLVNQLAGELQPDSGEVVFLGRDISSMPVHQRARAGLLRSYQITSVLEHFTVLENATIAAMGSKEHGYHLWRPLLSRRDLVEKAHAALKATNLSHRTNILCSELAYGERRQLELAIALVAEPRVLLLDEPLAGMSAQESETVIAFLKELKGQYSILLIEHDMNAVFALADRITVLVYGKVLLTGTPNEVRSDPNVKAAYLGDDVIN